MGCDRSGNPKGNSWEGFNPRTRMGCDSLVRGFIPRLSSFNPRTRMGCDSLGTEVMAPLTKFQSTHPHGVRRAQLVELGALFLVSIHAPAWGATCPGSASCFDFAVSIHAPAWGATVGWRVMACSGRSFNPRTRMGCDLLSGMCLSWRSCFNPRTRMGCDRTGQLQQV